MLVSMIVTPPAVEVEVSALRVGLTPSDPPEETFPPLHEEEEDPRSDVASMSVHNLETEEPLMGTAALIARRSAI